MTRATKIIGCALLLVLVGSGCTDDKQFADDMPTVTLTARVALADEDVGLVTESKNGEPCYGLRTDVVKGAESSLGQYGCLQSRDALSADYLVFLDHEAPPASGERLAVGGAVAPLVATVTVNGRPTQREGPFFLAVLPRIPDGDVRIVGADHTGKVVVDQRYPHALVTAQQTPASRSAPDPATRP